MRPFHSRRSFHGHAARRSHCAPAGAAPARLGQTVPFLRAGSWLTALSLILSFVALPVAAARPARPAETGALGQALTLRAQAGSARRALQKRQAAEARVREAVARSLRPRKSPLPSLAQMARRDAARRINDARLQVAPVAAPPPTLLDELGQLARPVPAAAVAGWKAEIKTTRPAPARAALLHLWLGEYALSHDQAPPQARWHLRQAQRLTGGADPLYGMAAYDSAVSLFQEGAYEEAATAFRPLQDPSSALAGYDRRNAALWLRHALACAGYHAQHAAQGIPEPPRLDPRCGAAALAACLKALGRPYDVKTALAGCRVTGEGSSMADVVAAGPKLGVDVRALNATDEGLRALPKPLVAYVEHDHFVAVVRADRGGVSYLCSDCGAWPGGRVDLSWAQWRTMNAGLYAAVTAPGSGWDRRLAALEPDTAGIRVATAGALSGLLADPARQFQPVMTRLPEVLPGVTLRTWALVWPECGNKVTSLRCPDCLICCLEDAIATGGVLVNLATGEAEYSPGPDLTVYNPHGPSVSWGRVYDSLGGGNGTGTNSDYGLGWSQTYNVGVASYPGADSAVYFANGSKIPFTMPSPPTAGTPVVPCGVGPGVPFTVEADYDTAGGGTYYTVTFKDRTRWVTNPTGNLHRMVDRNGNAIEFHYTTGYPMLLTSITDAGTGTKLLTVLREGDGRVAAVTDCYRREVYYHVGNYQNYNGTSYELDYVSQVVPACTANPPARYVYGYQNGGAAQYLQTITAPSPTGSGTSTATINYASGYVASLADANGNTHSYQNVDAAGAATSSPTNTTKVTVRDAAKNAVYSYVGGFDNNMSGTTRTDGAGNLISQKVFSDSNDPYRPSLVLDGNASGQQVVPQGGGAEVNPAGADAPASGTWDIKNPAGAVVASSASPSGWNVVKNTTLDEGGKPVTTNGLTVSAPSGASSAPGYEVRTGVGGSGYPGVSAVFAVVTGGGGSYGATGHTWDIYGNMTSETSPRGATTTYFYSHPDYFPLGELQWVQRGYASAGTTYSQTRTDFTYDDTDGYVDPSGAFHPCGLLSSVASPAPGSASGSGSRVTTTYRYDLTDQGQKPMGQLGLGNLVTVTAPGNNTGAITVNYNYTADGSYSQTAAIGEPLSVLVGDPLNVTNGTRQISHMRYDPRGHAVAAIDALGNETDATYNDADQPVLATLPATAQTGGGHGTSVSSYLYPGGPLLSQVVSDESGAAIREVDYAYGPEGETLGVSGSAEPVTYSYDALYRLKALTDGGGHTTYYFYNAAGYPYQIAYPGAASAPLTAPLAAGSPDTVTCPSYDADGNALASVDGNGVETDLRHDADPESRLTGVHYVYPSGYTGARIADVSCAYDAYGRCNAVADGTGTQRCGTDTLPGFDDLDDPLNVVTAYAGLPAMTVSYGYWPGGSRQSMSVSGLSGGFSYTYDRAGRMTGLTNPYGESSAWAYGDNGWLSGQALGDGAVTAYAHNQSGQVTDLQTKLGAAVLSEFSNQAYSGAGDRTSVTASLPAAPSGYSGTTAYGYDGGQSTPGLSRGQLTQEQSTRGGGYTAGFGYDGGTGAGPGNPTSFRGVSHAFNADNQDAAGTYDGDGSPVAYGGNSLSFDPEARLTGCGAALSAGYRADGLRAWKQDASGARTYFLYDGDVPVCELDGTSGAVTATNTFGANGLLSRHTGAGGTGAGSVFYTFDPSGNVAQRLDAGGSVLSSDLYDGFGNRTGTASTPDVFGFGGQWGAYTDAETGLVLMTHRYYDPGTGRFLTRDPMGYGGGVNLYAYTQNNPVNRSDPSGLFDENDNYIDEWESQMSQYLSDRWASVQNTLNGWSEAVGTTIDFLLGTGPTHRVYGPSSTQAQQLEYSLDGDQINADYCSGKTANNITTPGGFLNTIHQLSDGTQAQVGGFWWYSHTNSDGTVSFHVYNAISFHSLFYDGFKVVQLPEYNRAPWGFGPMGNIHQNYYWTESNPCGCGG